MVGRGAQVDAREPGQAASTRRSSGMSAKASAVGSTPRASAAAAGDAGGLLGGECARPLPLCTIARRNSPVASGVASTPPTIVAPADWPNRVTLPGSPPKAAIVLPHPAQCGDDVEQAAVGGRPGDVEEAGDAEPVVEGDEDDAVAGEGGAVVQRGPASTRRRIRRRGRTP